MSCQRVALRLRARAASASTPAAARHAAFASTASPTRAFASPSSHPAWHPARASRPALRLTRLHASSATATVPAAAALSKADVVDVLKERGLLDACTNEDELRKACADGSLSVYCGFDPTADSLHLGNLLGIVVLAWFQRCGHTPVALLGGATGRVGDPSGKSAERPVLDDDTINKNTAGIKAILERVLANGALDAGADVPAAKVMNNLDWFGTMGFLEFLREVGKYARVGTMMAKDSVKTRLDSEQGMSFTEFSYQLLQGYDFCHLFKEHDVRVQVGGSDQWGNITAGTDLIRRLADKEGAWGVTFPLLLKADGRKFGKSEDGAVWLSPERLSPYKFYQYMLQSTDADVVRFMRMLTFVPLAEIEAIEAGMSAEGYVPNTAQKRLAEEVTRFVHGVRGSRAGAQGDGGPQARRGYRAGRGDARGARGGHSHRGPRQG